MDVKCPNCGKDQRKEEIEKTNIKELNEYKNQLADEVKESIQNILRDDFKKKLEQIDEKYSAPKTISNLRFELKELKKDVKLLKEKETLKGEYAHKLSYKIERLKSDHDGLIENMQNTYKELIEEFFKSTIKEQKNTTEKYIDLHHGKTLLALENKKKKLCEKISLKKQEYSIHEPGFDGKKREIEDLEVSISHLKEEIYKSAIEEKEGKKKNEILKKALKDN